METANFRIKVPKTFPVTADYSYDWIREQVKLISPMVKGFEVQDVKVEYTESASEKVITAQCVLYRH